MRLTSDPFFESSLGLKSYRLQHGGESKSDQPQTFSPPRDKRSFVWTVIPADGPRTLWSWLQRGFQLVEVRLTFSRPGFGNPEKSNPVKIRKSIDADREAILHIAQNSFTFTRFHADPILPEGAGARIKYAWMENAVVGRRGDFILVATSNSDVVGFLNVLISGKPDSPIWCIDLVAVNPKTQRQGIGGALVEEFVRLAPDNAELVVGTQAVNLPSTRLYEEKGFRMKKVEYVLHGHWVDGQSLIGEKLPQDSVVLAQSEGRGF